MTDEFVRITELTQITDPEDLSTSDLVLTVDVSDTSDSPDGTTKTFSLATLSDFFSSFFGVAGGDRQVQFNDDGDIGADENLTYADGALNVGNVSEDHSYISPGSVRVFDEDGEIVAGIFNDDPALFGLGAQFDKTAYFSAEAANVVSTGAATIDWTAGNKQSLTLDDDCTVTFDNPPGPASLIFRLIQDETGSRTVTWPEGIYWPDATEPTLSTDPDAIDIISFYFDGDSYYGSYTLGFAVPV
jgi:hypothetical protein